MRDHRPGMSFSCTTGTAHRAASGACWRFAVFVHNLIWPGPQMSRNSFCAASRLFSRSPLLLYSSSHFHFSLALAHYTPSHSLGALSLISLLTSRLSPCPPACSALSAVLQAGPVPLPTTTTTNSSAPSLDMGAHERTLSRARAPHTNTRSHRAAERLCSRNQLSGRSRKASSFLPVCLTPNEIELFSFCTLSLARPLRASADGFTASLATVGGKQGIDSPARAPARTHARTHALTHARTHARTQAAEASLRPRSCCCRSCGM